jgi:Protein of unknown function (DUF4232)
MSARRPEDDLPRPPGAQGAASREAPEVAPCGPEDLTIEVHWERDAGRLRGQLVARNTGGRACRLAGKPTVTPLAADGTPLPVQTVISLEMIQPGYALLRPGDVATSRISWNTWCGDPGSDRALVDWHGGSAVVPVHGPVQPDCDPAQRPQMTSYWFFLQTPADPV